MYIRISNVFIRMSDRWPLLHVILALVAGLGATDFLIDHILLGFEMNHDLHSAIQAIIVGSLGGLAIWSMVKGIERQRAFEREQMRRLGELNHRLRNSLELIVDAHYLDPDVAHKQMIMETVNQMDEAMRQLCTVEVGQHSHGTVNGV